MFFNFNRFQPPDDPSDRDLKMNNLYYKRLDVLEEIRELQNRIESLEDEAYQIERQLNDMRCSP